MKDFQEFEFSMEFSNLAKGEPPWTIHEIHQGENNYYFSNQIQHFFAQFDSFKKIPTNPIKIESTEKEPCKSTHSNDKLSSKTSDLTLLWSHIWCQMIAPKKKNQI